MFNWVFLKMSRLIITCFKHHCLKKLDQAKNENKILIPANWANDHTLSGCLRARFN